MKSFTKLFWLDASERAIKTFAQTLSVVLLASESVLGLLGINWIAALSVAGMATVVSVLTSIYSAGNGNSASLVIENVKTKEPN